MLALANRPTYDMNLFSDSDARAHRNRAVTDYFEPGSVFKIVAASALLEKGRVKLQDRFFCENGQYWVGGRLLHDHRPHGTLSFQEVIEQSSNIGTVKAAQRLSRQEMYYYVKAFGFGDLTGIDLAGEVEGVARPPVAWSGTTMSSLPIGQEVTSTAVQLACAMSVIANGGVLVKPWVIREVRDPNGETIESFSPQVVRRVISGETAQTMRRLLKGVIEKGTGTLGRLDTYTAAGKTGTAQKVEPSGVYSHSRFIASFIGFAPADDPRIVVVVCADEPHPLYFGGVVSAPAFKRVAEDTLRYLGVNADAKKNMPLKVVSCVSAGQD
jgi:cell division protein FtsI (penicillin-binding protein 3)